MLKQFVAWVRCVKILAIMFVCSISANTNAAANLAERIAQSNPDQGRRHAVLCAACHAVEKDQASRIGPNLWNIVDRPMASMASFHYSKALRDRKGVWDYEQLDAFLQSPSGYAPGTYMVFQGIADEKVRAQVIRYLASLSDNPTEFPDSTPALIEPQQEVFDPFGADWPKGKGRTLTGNTCSVCHSLAIVKQQGQTRAGWAELIDWMVEEQGMAALPEADLEVVLQYLGEHFNIDSK